MKKTHCDKCDKVLSHQHNPHDQEMFLRGSKCYIKLEIVYTESQDGRYQLDLCPNCMSEYARRVYHAFTPTATDPTSQKVIEP